MSLSSETSTRFIRDIIQRVRAGHVQIPSFQRGMVWRSQQIVELLDSIRRGYPIGTLLLWRRPGTAGVLRVGPLRIDTLKLDDAWFVVDGQQRMLTLTAALTRTDERPSVDVYAVWFDLERQEFFYNNGRRSLATAVPVNALGDHVRLLRWAQAWPLAHERPELIDLAFKTSDLILGYAVSTYVTSTKSESEVRELFRRANSSGVKMKESEVFEGKHGGDAGGLEELLRRLADVGFPGRSDDDDGDSDGDGDGSLVAATADRRARDERPLLFRCWKAANNLNPRLTAEQAPKPTDESLDRAEDAVRKSVALLVEDAGFPSLSFVPYRNVLIPLSRFFSVHQDPSIRARQMLGWFVWRGGLSGEHSKSSHPWVEAMIRRIDDDAEVTAQRWLDTVQAFDGGPFDWREGWNGRSAHTKVGAALLWDLIDPATRPISEPIGRLFTPAIDADRPAIALFVQRPSSATPKAVRQALRGAVGDVVRARQQIPELALPALMNDDVEAFLRLREPLLQRHSEQVLALRAGLGATPHRSVASLRQAAVQA